MAFSRPSDVVKRAMLSEGNTVADFGAGSGHYSFAAAEAVGPYGKVYAIDILPDLVSRIAAHAKEKSIKNVSVLTGDIERVGESGLPDSSADWVFLANVLFQLSEPALALREAKRVLKKDGKLLLVDWEDSFGGMGPQPEHVFTEEDGRKLAGEEGFAFVRKIDAGSHHWGIVCKV